MSACTNCIRYDYVQFEENGPEWRYCHGAGIAPLTKEQAETGCDNCVTPEDIVVTEAAMEEARRILAGCRGGGKSAAMQEVVESIISASEIDWECMREIIQEREE